jgi:LPXTG-motif cell wall-anchored protein
VVTQETPNPDHRELPPRQAVIGAIEPTALRLPQTGVGRSWWVAASGGALAAVGLLACAGLRRGG